MYESRARLSVKGVAAFCGKGPSNAPRDPTPPDRQRGYFGNIQVTTQALSELLDRDIPLALYTRHGRLKGHLVPDVSKNVLLRVSQYKTALDRQVSLSIAKAIVRAKLLNSVQLLSDYRSHYPSANLATGARPFGGTPRASQRCRTTGVAGTRGLGRSGLLRPLWRNEPQ